MTKVLDDDPPPAPVGDVPDPFGLVGKEIAGKYKVVREIAQGGMGVLYEVVHKHLGTRLAVKFIKMYGIKDKASFVERFMREARVGAQLKHPGIAIVFDLEWHTDGATPYLVMELLEGQSFGTRLRKAGGKIDWREAFETVARAIDPIAAAHAIGITHRDLKPDNIYLCADGTLKVLDFGIALLADEKRLTRTGMLMGTPLYMSREQVSAAKDIDGRADVYSLGVVLYHAITGKPIFDASNEMELLMKLASESPVDVQRLVPALPDHAASVIRKATAKERDARYLNIVEFKAALAASLRAGGSALSASPTERTLQEIPDATRAPTVQEGGNVPEAIESQVSSRRIETSSTNSSPTLKRPPVSKRKSGLIALVAIAALSATAGAGWWWHSGRTVPPSASATPAAPAIDRPAPSPQPATAPTKTSPSAGRVHIVSIPPGAAVFVGDQKVGTTPFELSGAPETVQTVRLVLDGYVPKVEQVLPTVEGGTAEIVMKPVNRALRESSAPESEVATNRAWLSVYVFPFAIVKVDGKEAGDTPILKLSLKPGRHLVEIEHPPTKQHQRQNVTIEPGQHRTLRLKFNAGDKQ